MSKVKAIFIVCIVILFAVVAVFPNLGNSRAFQGSKLNGASPSVSPVEILTADGGDPVPPPRPLPWVGVAS
jgi:hypothetical protein